MPVLINSETPVQQIAPNVGRKLVHLKGLMTVIVDFTKGPQAEPDPAHSHPHEQISYIANGEVNVFIDGKKNCFKGRRYVCCTCQCTTLHTNAHAYC